MRNNTFVQFLLTVTLAVFFGGALLYAQQEMKHEKSMDKMSHGMVWSGKDVKWMEGPDALPRGVKMAVLDGDPGGKDPYTLRLKLPANYKIPPHWHPAIENVTVLSGNFYLGMGDKFSKNDAKEIKVGGFGNMPAEQHHFAYTKTETVVQIHGIGPFAITYVDPKDDPRTGSTSTKE